MPEPSPATVQIAVRFLANVPVSSGLIRMDLELERPLAFAAGQFAMVNLTGDRALVFSRPFSILSATADRLSFLYRVVGRGTAALAGLRAGQALTVLGPLGRAFPDPADLAGAGVVAIAGGVGLPPLHNWLARHGRPGDIGFFGGRDGGDIPWDMLDARWQVSVDRAVDIPAGRAAWPGRVTDCAAAHPDLQDARPRVVLGCGPIPMLRAAAALARAHDWPCHVSLEEHMGCGYGACKGCVVPVRLSGSNAWRNATCCDEGPVFPAEMIRWDRYGRPAANPAEEPT